MNEQRVDMYAARDGVLQRDPDALRQLALEHAEKTCTEIVQG